MQQKLNRKAQNSHNLRCDFSTRANVAYKFTKVSPDKLSVTTRSLGIAQAAQTLSTVTAIDGRISFRVRNLATNAMGRMIAYVGVACKQKDLENTSILKSRGAFLMCLQDGRIISNGKTSPSISENNEVGAYTDVILNTTNGTLSFSVNDGAEVVACKDPDLQLTKYELFPTIFLNSKNVSIGFENPEVVEEPVADQALEPKAQNEQLQAQIDELIGQLEQTTLKLQESNNARDLLSQELAEVEDELEEILVEKDEEIAQMKEDHKKMLELFFANAEKEKKNLQQQSQINLTELKGKMAAMDKMLDLYNQRNIYDEIQPKHELTVDLVKAIVHAAYQLEVSENEHSLNLDQSNNSFNMSQRSGSKRILIEDMNSTILSNYSDQSSNGPDLNLYMFDMLLKQVLIDRLHQDMDEPQLRSIRIQKVNDFLLKQDRESLLYIINSPDIKMKKSYKASIHACIYQSIQDIQDEWKNEQKKQILSINSTKSGNSTQPTEAGLSSVIWDKTLSKGNHKKRTSQLYTLGDTLM